MICKDLCVHLNVYLCASLLVICFFNCFANGQGFVGDRCTKSGVPGTCLSLRSCQSALNDIRNRRNPQICSFDGANPIVCCVDSSLTTTTTARPVFTTTTKRPTVFTTTSPRPWSSTTEEYIPPAYDYDDREKGTTCPPIQANLTTSRTGRKAWDKCIEYQDLYVYPCETATALSEVKTRDSKCGHDVEQLIIGGTDVKPGEFPHMVLLGFGSDASSAQWLCGGSIISESFVLTAGHCTSSREYGPVTYGLVDILRRSEQWTNDQVYRISRIVKHPGFNPPQKYNDIALLETDRKIKLSKSVVPACVDTGSGVSYEVGLATGWGLTTNRGDVSDTLQKVQLHPFTNAECGTTFPPTRLMANGFQASTQFCYGDRTMKKDTCQGDSGGPLQTFNKKIHCMWTVTGITSFGKACGFEGVPAIYTRVSAYTSWIESVVWP